MKRNTTQPTPTQQLNGQDNHADSTITEIVTNRINSFRSVQSNQIKVSLSQGEFHKIINGVITPPILSRYVQQNPYQYVSVNGLKSCMTRLLYLLDKIPLKSPLKIHSKLGYTRVLELLLKVVTEFYQMPFQHPLIKLHDFFFSFNCIDS